MQLGEMTQLVCGRASKPNVSESPAAQSRDAHAPCQRAVPDVGASVQERGLGSSLEHVLCAPPTLGWGVRGWLLS